jgi:Endoplasmic reticulum-based factor for assembly of V-ATPase
MTIHGKRLEGVTATHSLLSIYDECLSLAKTEPTKPLLTSVSTDSSEEAPPTTPVASSSTCRISALSPSPPTMKKLVPCLSLEDARSTLVEFDKKQWKSETTTKNLKCLPIRVILAMQVLLQNNTINTNNTHDDNAVAVTVTKLEEALNQIHLQFTPPPRSPPVNNNNKDDVDADADDSLYREKLDFEKRLARLRLQNEETKYYKMTSNVSTQSKKDDDITTKSMTYAASVGLNMIVAPLSFGIFMYFFSGPILNFCWSNFRVHPGAVDIRRVIIGVISGVVMLFIEMLLFVIRTHEMDRQMQKKLKKNKGTSAIKPFGEYSSAMEKKFVNKGD